MLPFRPSPQFSPAPHINFSPPQTVTFSPPWNTAVTSPRNNNFSPTRNNNSSPTRTNNSNPSRTNNFSPTRSSKFSPTRTNNFSPPQVTKSPSNCFRSSSTSSGSTSSPSSHLHHFALPSSPPPLFPPHLTNGGAATTNNMAYSSCHVPNCAHSSPPLPVDFPAGSQPSPRPIDSIIARGDGECHDKYVKNRSNSISTGYSIFKMYLYFLGCVRFRGATYYSVLVILSYLEKIRYYLGCLTLHCALWVWSKNLSLC